MKYQTQIRHWLLPTRGLAMSCIGKDPPSGGPCNLKTEIIMWLRLEYAVPNSAGSSTHHTSGITMWCLVHLQDLPHITPVALPCGVWLSCRIFHTSHQWHYHVVFGCPAGSSTHHTSGITMWCLVHLQDLPHITPVALPCSVWFSCRIFHTSHQWHYHVVFGCPAGSSTHHTSGITMWCLVLLQDLPHITPVALPCGVWLSCRIFHTSHQWHYHVVFGSPAGSSTYHTSGIYHVVFGSPAAWESSTHHTSGITMWCLVVLQDLPHITPVALPCGVWFSCGIFHTSHQWHYHVVFGSPAGSSTHHTSGITMWCLVVLQDLPHITPVALPCGVWLSCRIFHTSHQWHYHVVFGSPAGSSTHHTSGITMWCLVHLQHLPHITPVALPCSVWFSCRIFHTSHQWHYHVVFGCPAGSSTHHTSGITMWCLVLLQDLPHITPVALPCGVWLSCRIFHTSHQWHYHVVFGSPAGSSTHHTSGIYHVVFGSPAAWGSSTHHTSGITMWCLVLLQDLPHITPVALPCGVWFSCRIFHTSHQWHLPCGVWFSCGIFHTSHQWHYHVVFGSPAGSSTHHTSGITMWCLVVLQDLPHITPVALPCGVWFSCRIFHTSHQWHYHVVFGSPAGSSTHHTSGIYHVVFGSPAAWGSSTHHTSGITMWCLVLLQDLPHITPVALPSGVWLSCRIFHTSHQWHYHVVFGSPAGSSTHHTSGITMWCLVHHCSEKESYCVNIKIQEMSDIFRISNCSCHSSWYVCP